MLRLVYFKFCDKNWESGLGCVYFLFLIGDWSWNNLWGKI